MFYFKIIFDFNIKMEEWKDQNKNFLDQTYCAIQTNTILPADRSKRILLRRLHPYPLTSGTTFSVHLQWGCWQDGLLLRLTSTVSQNVRWTPNTHCVHLPTWTWQDGKNKNKNVLVELLPSTSGKIFFNHKKYKWTDISEFCYRESSRISLQRSF